MLLVATLLSTALFAGDKTKDAVDPSAVLGVWMGDNGQERFEIYEKDGLYFGKIVWTAYDDLNGHGLKDMKNPDETKRDSSIIGLDILLGFKYKGNGHFIQGKVYDPGSGKTYKCKIKVDGDRAEVRGYILVPMLGRTEVAYRYVETSSK